MISSINNQQSIINNPVGFSLMELLVVISILALLVGLSAPAVTSSLRASSLSGSGEQLVDHLNHARQTALSRNLPVEVRFYKLPGHAEPANSSPSTYRAVQSFLLDDTTAVPLGRPQHFTQPVLCSPDIDDSSLMDDTLLPEKSPASTDAIPAYGVNFVYRSFYFKPSGTTSLPNTDAFVTLILENDKTPAQGGNFFTVQIDPLTGRTRTFRP